MANIYLLAIYFSGVRELLFISYLIVLIVIFCNNFEQKRAGTIGSFGRLF